MQLSAPAPVGVVGAGTMGAGIAQTAAVAGHPVLLFDASGDRTADAVDGIRSRLDREVARGRLDAQVAAEALARLQPAGQIGELAGCGLVIEAAVEALKIKRLIFADLEAVVGDDCVLATNTSSLSVTAVAAGMRRAQRCVGMHFFNPAPVMRLVEVVSGLATDPVVATAVCELARQWGKTPVRVTSTPGFIVNRVARPFYGEGLLALEEGIADPATVDAVMRESGGFRMGPLELTDLIGQDVNLGVSRSVWEMFGQDRRYAPSLVQQALVDAGRLGRKSGRGFYRYDDGGAIDHAAAQPDSAPAEKMPRHVRVFGDWGPWNPLWDRAARRGVAVTPGDLRDSADPHVELPDRALLVPTDGRTATERAAASGHPVLTIDLALDPATATRYAIAASKGCPAESAADAVGLLQATGAAVSVVADLPGLLVARTVAMLVNEAVDVVSRRVATVEDVDTAMSLGMNYPIGPLAWGDRIGPARVVTVLDALHRAYPDGRYRVCTGLRRAAWCGGRLGDL